MPDPAPRSADKQAADNAAQMNLIMKFRDKLADKLGREVSMEEAARIWIMKYAKEWRAKRDAMEALIRGGFLAFEELQDPTITQIYKKYVGEVGAAHILETISL